MAKDNNRFLYLKGTIWYVCINFPKDFVVEDLRGKKIRLSTLTDNIEIARSLRDRHIVPLMKAADEKSFMESLADDLMRTSERVKVDVRGRLVSLGVKGFKTDSEALTLGRLINLFTAHQKGSIRVSSERVYAVRYRLLLHIIGTNTVVNTITPTTLSDYVATAKRFPLRWSDSKSVEEILSAKAERTISPNLVSASLTLLKSALVWGMANGKLPGYKLPIDKKKDLIRKIDQKHKRPPTMEELAALQSMPCPAGMCPKAWRYAPVIGRYTGLRIGEVMAMEQRYIRVTDGFLCIHVEGEVKTKNSVRVVPVSDTLRPYIDELLSQANGNGRLFSCDKNTYGQAFALSAKRAVADDLSFHCYRVYFNNELVRGGVDETDKLRLVGHACGSVNSVYTIAEIGRYKIAVDKVR